MGSMRGDDASAVVSTGSTDPISPPVGKNSGRRRDQPRRPGTIRRLVAMTGR